MSFKLGGIVIEDLVRDISTHEKLMLAAWASYAYRDGSRIWAAQETIAELAICSPRAVRDAVKKFINSGVLIKMGKTRRTPEYRLDIERAIALHGRLKKPESGAAMPEGKAAHGAAMPEGKAAHGAAMPEGKAAHGAGVIPATDSKIPAPDDQKAAHGAGNPVNPGLNPSGPPGGGGEKAPPAAAELDKHWLECQDAIRLEVPENVYNGYFGEVRVLNDFGGRLILAVPTRLFRDVLTKWLEAIEKATDRKVKIIILSKRERPAA